MSGDDPIFRGLEAAVRAATDHDLDLARDHLAALDLDYARELRRSKLASVAGAVRASAVSPDLRSKRGSIPSATKRAIFERDRYTCRLCGLRTIDLEVLKALSRAFPVELPFHPGWKQDVASPIYWTHSTSLEHVVPIARGGADDETNFATSCYACNDARVDYLLEELGWELLPIASSPWNGLREHLPVLRRLEAGPEAPTVPLQRAEPAKLVELRVGMLVRARRAGAKRRSTFRVDAIDAMQGVLLREMWKSAGAWVESKSAAWSEVDGEVEVVAKVAPDPGHPAGE